MGEGRDEGAEAPPDTLIEIDHLDKAVNGTSILEDVSLEVRAGQVFGLIGPSGCGKTTLVRIAIGLTAPTRGRVRVLGEAPVNFSLRARERIGYMPQAFFLDPALTVQQNARFVASLYGMGWLRRRGRVRELLSVFELEESRKRPVRAISGGMQRRLSLACALVHEPALLFADEPTAGLDPVLRGKVWEHLHALKRQGLTTVLTTQYIDEIRHCDVVGIMRHGRVIAVDSPAGLRRRAMPWDALEVETANGFSPEDIGALRRLPFVHDVHWLRGGLLRLIVEDSGTAIPEVTRILDRRGPSLVAVRASSPTFDDVFRELVSPP